MSDKPSTTPAVMGTLAFIVIGVIVAVIGHQVIGGVVAALGVIPACYGAWLGMQQDTQGGLAASLGLVFVSLGVAALLIVLGLVDGVAAWFK